VWVYFNEKVREDYGTVLRYFYEHSLKWAYNPRDIPFPKEEIQYVLSTQKKLDMEGFLGYFYLWSYASTRLTLPIPHLERIIPYPVSRWNAMKGGSDTLTKILWHNMYDPPCNTPQGHAVARMILLGNAIIHRLNQLFTAKADLDSGYPSLKHFRNAANKRSSFHNTLLSVVHVIKNKSSNGVVISEPMPSLIEGVRTRRKDTRTKSVIWGTTATGSTPTRNVNKWYTKVPTNPTESLLHARVKECIGVPIYRVDPKTKSNKGPGSRGHCTECQRQTNYFCIICKKWLCDPQLAASRPKALDKNGEECRKVSGMDDPKFIQISFDDRVRFGKKDPVCAVFSCWHKAHQTALEANGAFERGLSYDDDMSCMSSP